MNKKGFLLAPAVAAVLVGGPGMAMGAAASPAPASSAVIMSVTDGQLSDSDVLRLSNGKYASGSATYTRSTNSMSTTLHVATPYLLVGARGTVTMTVYADTPFGRYPLWTFSHGLTACGLWDFTCSSSPTQTWKDTPSYWDAQRVQQYGSSVDTTVSVS